MLKGPNTIPDYPHLVGIIPDQNSCRVRIICEPMGKTEDARKSGKCYIERTPEHLTKSGHHRRDEIA
jgi:hypothetical protein